MSPSESCPILVSVRSADFDTATEIRQLSERNRNIGAVVSFTGLCRDENGKLSALELEHYPGMAEAEIKRIARSAADRWSLSGLSIIHRYGLIEPGENIVLVLTASAHRKDAFEAASFLMDYLKTDAPFWKREHFADGQRGDWVAASTEDQQRRQRWQNS